jgi:DNA-binding NarL/FixJ family response regulator
VKTHVASIFNKLGVGSRAEATLRAARLNIVQ